MSDPLYACTDAKSNVTALKQAYNSASQAATLCHAH
ncbi:hypothetical protein MASSI9I_51051 [Massilia sp. 9I]|nr:hypothetical protein MASSI9I_51051 [Massilia sp. 9I]